MSSNNLNVTLWINDLWSYGMQICQKLEIGRIIYLIEQNGLLYCPNLLFELLELVHELDLL
jgi:hypothetical protein